jgi:hypothetical protein
MGRATFYAPLLDRGIARGVTIRAEPLLEAGQLEENLHNRPKHPDGQPKLLLGGAPGASHKTLAIIY